MRAQGPVPPTQTSSWLGRNWKWVVPLGCLTSIVAFVAGIAAIVVLVFGFMKSSDVYQQALRAASSHQEVIEALGEPVAPGWYVSGSINVSGSSGTADISIPIAGPKGNGTIFAVAKKSAGRWSYDVLEVELEGREERVDLKSRVLE
jgi:Cytochrome oxidase complex assembly protein 1